MAIFVNINEDYVDTGNAGTESDPLNWDEFTNVLSGGNGVPSTETYYLSGYRNVNINFDNLYYVKGNSITITNWGTEPFKIYNDNFTFGFNLSGIDSFKVQNGMFESSGSPCDILGGEGAYDFTQNLTYDNCYFLGKENADEGMGISINISNCANINIINCTFSKKSGSPGSFIFFSSSAVNIVNSIIIGPTTFFGYSETTVSIDNCITDSSEFTAGEYYEIGSSAVTNCQFNFSQPAALSADISAVTPNDFNYLSGGFEDISVTGDTSYNDGIWWNGTRDGIGALFFPSLSGISISASSATSPIDSSVDFVLSGNDPFTAFSATSAVYNFDDGYTSAVNFNDTLTHSFTSNGSFDVFATITSRNEWYTFTTNTFEILVGDFIVTISIYKNGNDITNSSATFFDNLTFLASTIGLAAGSYKWDFGDGTSGDSDTETKYYTSGATFTIGLSGYALDDSSVSSTDTATLSISSTSAIYFVDINSSYDVCGSNVGTSADPFNWGEFRGRVETSGDYNDTYRLRGSRNLDYGSTSNRNVLSVDRRKNFTIRDWDVSAYGPWVWIVEDFSVFDENSVLSAGGCTLRNGIIYNKRYSSPGFGGKIILSRTYNMFVVYQGEYSRIQIDPMNYMLSGTTESVIVTGTSSDKPSWVDYDTYIFEDYNYEDLGCGNVNPFWSSGVSAGSFSAVDTSTFSGCVRYGTDEINYNTSSTCFSGGFIIETQIFIGESGGNESVHLVLNEQDGTEIFDFNTQGGDRIEYNSEVVSQFNEVPGYYIWFKIERESGSNVISASYKHDFNETVSAVGETTGVYYFAGSAEYSGCSYITGDSGENAWGTGPLYWQAEYGFPETWTSGISSTTIGVDSAGYIVASAGSNIIGSTIYLSGDGWSDYFNSATYSAFDQSDYDVSIIDSVITNLTKETSEQFSACGLILMNSTFSNSYSTISGNFTVETNDENQFGWIPPTDYPFTPSNALYNKDIDFINSNKKYLKPFDGITAPPNPGRNYYTYPNYETGLFGYSRKDYDRGE